MKIPKTLFISILILSFIGVLYISGNIQPASNSPAIPTVIPTAVQSVASVSAKCRAVFVDSSDPQSYLPDKTCTPGVVDPSVNQDNIYTTICRSGYTQSVRPSVSYTNSLKKQQIIDYGYENKNMGDYEEDHLISLELGGDPKDPKNLWPQPHPSINEKDKVENYLHSLVCSGKLTLIKAQEEISTNWYDVFKQMK